MAWGKTRPSWLNGANWVKKGLNDWLNKWMHWMNAQIRAVEIWILYIIEIALVSFLCSRIRDFNNNNWSNLINNYSSRRKRGHSSRSNQPHQVEHFQNPLDLIHIFIIYLKTTRRSFRWKLFRMNHQKHSGFSEISNRDPWEPAPAFQLRYETHR